jgi:ATP-binding cassette subfamily F protein 3
LQFVGIVTNYRQTGLKKQYIFKTCSLFLGVNAVFAQLTTDTFQRLGYNKRVTIMISLSNISKSYGLRCLFSGISFSVMHNDRVAVIGANGSGKTTLFEIIDGTVSPDTGTITRKNGITLGYLRQDTRLASDCTVLEEVAGACDAINNLAHKIDLIHWELSQPAEQKVIDTLLVELGELQALYALRGGYDSEHEAKKILSGLGFSETDYQRKSPEFSGGWQTRIQLARLLFINPDVLMLDEATNYLDLETQRWFEYYLKSYHGAVLFTSHDRAFLSSLAGKILSIENDEVIFFNGSYDDYVLARVKDIEARQATARRQQEVINRQMHFVERFRYNATKAAQVQSRIKHLDKIKPIQVPRSLKKIRFNFSEPPKSGQKVIELIGITKNYGELNVFSDLNLAIERQDRVAIVGMNGAGKTTLLRILAGVLDFNSGQRMLGHNVSTAYFAQHYIEMLKPDNTLLEEIRRIAPHEPEQRLRALLGAFLFSGDDVNKNVAVLSGGEKARLAIAKLLVRPANFLLMDEPTNHMDIPSREALTNALDGYKGTLCFITHDRTLIREIASKIIEVKDGNIKVFAGNYDEFLARQSAGSGLDACGISGSKKISANPITNNGSSRRQLKARAGELRNQLYQAVYPLERQVVLIEKEIDQISSRISQIEKQMANPDHYKDSQQVVAINLEYIGLKDKLAQLTGKWEMLIDQTEEIRGSYRYEIEKLDR